MQLFSPVKLLDINIKLIEKYPLPENFAQADPSAAEDIITKMKHQNKSLFELSSFDLHYVFQIAELCTEDEFAILKTVVLHKADKSLFQIGFIYCQNNAESHRATELFSIICNKIRQKQPEIYNNSLMAKVGLPWSEIYLRSLEVIHLENLTLDQFCDRYNIIIPSLFYTHLKLTYLSKCDKSELGFHESFLIESILTAKLDILRPVLLNFTEKLEYDEISDGLKNAILKRLSLENNDMVIGVSPLFLRQIRQQQYGKMLEENISHLRKRNIYLSIINKIKNIQQLDNGFFAIYFQNHVVIENIHWVEYAYAYSQLAFKNFLESWLSLGTPEDYWPAISEDKIIAVRDAFLDIEKSGVIKLRFKEFDILYTKDILSGLRY